MAVSLMLLILAMLLSWYLPLKTLHIVSFVAWFAGLFYLPRLFVYHTEEGHSPLFLMMEKRLCYYIMMPAALMTLGSGGALFSVGLWSLDKANLWLHYKLLAVFFLLLYHLYCVYCIRGFKEGKNRHSSRFYRLFNEIPTLLLIAIVTLAVLKPA